MDEEVRKTLDLLKTDQARVAVAESFWLFAPRGVTLEPGVSGMFSNAGWLAVLWSGKPKEPIESPTTPPPPKFYLPDIGALLVGLAVGIVVGVLLTMQVRLLRKPAPTPSS